MNQNFSKSKIFLRIIQIEVFSMGGGGDFVGTNLGGGGQGKILDF